MGLIAGYHLSLAGADVTFLVRPARLQALRSPQILYCHNDGQLKQFSEYQAISSADEIKTESLEFVLVTLDGASARAPDGCELLRSIGQAIHANGAKLIIGGVGVGLLEHTIAMTGLPPERVLQGVLGLLSYQVAAAKLPVQPPERAEQIERAGMAYVQFPSKVGFIMEGRHVESAKAFAALYERCGVSRCSVINSKLFNVLTNSPFPIFAISEIAGWPPIGDLAKNRELWQLNTRAQAEIARLKQHGWVGKLVALVLTDRMQLKLNQKIERDALPLDFQAFNRFHHGGKVQAQDIEIMQNCVAVGISQGFAMSALKEVLVRLDAHKQAQAGYR